MKPRINLRGIVFSTAFFLWTALECLEFTWMLLVPRPKFLSYLMRYQRGLDWLERKVLGLTYRIEGELPEGPVLVAMKHQSTWETMKLHLLWHDPAIVLKKELLDLPLWGKYVTMLDLIPIDRSAGQEAIAKMIEVAQRAKAAKRAIIIFPQGTRVPPGETKPYKRGIIHLYEATGLPIVPVALNSGLFWPKRLFCQRPGTITLKVLDPIPPGLPPREALALLEERLEAASDALLADQDLIVAS